MRLDRLTNQFELIGVADPDQHNREISGNAVSPQSGLPLLVSDENAGAGPSQGGGHEDRRSQPPVGLRFSFGDTQLLQQDMAMSPGEVEHAVG